MSDEPSDEELVVEDEDDQPTLVDMIVSGTADFLKGVGVEMTNVVAAPICVFVGTITCQDDILRLGRQCEARDIGNQKIYIAGKAVDLVLGAIWWAIVAAISVGALAELIGPVAGVMAGGVGGGGAAAGVLAEAIAIPAELTAIPVAVTVESRVLLTNVGDLEKDLKNIRYASRMTSQEAKAAAKKLGYEPVSRFSKSKERIFFNSKKGLYISQDVGSGNGMGSHNGGVWKMAKRIKDLFHKRTRMGTYNADLTVRIGD